ncbi:MAG TPA: hypothetical protein VHG69_00420 [Thermoleophilaceae bacterium]|nr:hypothetical protein [Thermoleophilaceae bacterium]
MAAEAGTDVRGRAARRITRLEERLGQTRVQLDRAKGRRDELEQLLQRMVDAESSRRDQLKVREAEIERQEAQLEKSRQELEQRAAEAERERAELERREQESRTELESLRSKVAELEGRSEEAFQALNEELRQARSEAEHEREQRLRLDAQLSEQRDLARDASRQLVAAVDRREELEAGYEELRADADEARALVADAERRLTQAERENERLQAEIEKARARSAEEREWHDRLEARLSETEKQAESVLQDLDEELEIALGRAALERERRVAAETRLEELEHAQSQAEQATPPVAADPPEELADARREIERLHAELDVARSAGGGEAPWTPEPGESHAELESLRTELEDTRAEADTLKVSQEQSRRRILQLEDRLGDAPADVSSQLEEPVPAEPTFDGPDDEEPSEEKPATEDAAGRRRRLLGSARGAERQTRAPLKDPSELPGMSDEELAQAFTAMREAAKLADARGDRDSAKSHRALARAVAEEAAGRPLFGETKVRGRKRNRALKELAAAREKALELRPLVARPVAEDWPPAD